MVWFELRCLNVDYSALMIIISQETIFSATKKYSIALKKISTAHTSQKEESYLREQKSTDLRHFCSFEIWFVAIFAIFA